MYNFRTPIACLLTGLASITLAIKAVDAQGSYAFNQSDVPLTGGGYSNNQTQVGTGDYGSQSYNLVATNSGSNANGNGSSRGSALSTPGALHAFATASSFDWVGGYAFDVAEAAADDYLKVGSSSGLAPGTPNTLLFSFSVDDTVTPYDTIPFFAEQAEVHASYFANDTSIGGATSGDYLDGNLNGVSNPPNTLTFSLPSEVGDVIHIDMLLYVATQAAGIGANATADAGDTASFYVESLTPGVTLTAESGHDYSPIASLPDTGMGMLFIMGLFGLICCYGGLQRNKPAF
jgi:hypothetical protein